MYPYVSKKIFNQTHRTFSSYYLINKLTYFILLPSRLGLENAPTAPLQRGKPRPNKCPGYDSKQSDSEVSVMLGLWGMQSTSSLPLLPG